MLQLHVADHHCAQDPPCCIQGLPGQGRIQDHQWPEDLWVLTTAELLWIELIGLLLDVTGPESATKAILVIYGQSLTSP